MVSNIGETNLINQYTKMQENKENVSKLLKYVNNEPIAEDKGDSFSSSVKINAAFIGLFEGIPLLNLMVRNKKLNNIANKTFEIINQNNINAMQNITKTKDGLFNFIETAKNSKEIYKNLQSAVKNQSAKNIKNINNDIVKLTAKQKAIEAKIAKRNSSGFIENIRNTFDTKKLNKVSNKLSNSKTSLTKAKNAVNTVENAAKTASTTVNSVGKLGRFKNFVKSSGAIGMMVLSGVFEFIGEVAPTFKELGPEKGMKQLGKSTVKVIGDTVGFITGQSIGTALGTAAGTAAATKIATMLGTAVCPGVGTVVGSILGFALGTLGSTLMGKLTSAVVGKPERELAKEKQEKQNIEEYSKNPDSFEKLKFASYEKLQAESESGQLSNDAIEIINILEKMDSQSNPFVA